MKYMKKISEIMEEYGISKEELLSLLEKITGKTYSPKTTRIWDSTFEKVKKEITSVKKKKKELKKWKEKEILTSHDVDEIDFLAATLWVKHFDKEETEKKPEPKKEEKVSKEKSSFKVIKKDTSKSSEPKREEKNYKKKFSVKKSDDFQKKKFEKKSLKNMIILSKVSNKKKLKKKL